MQHPWRRVCVVASALLLCVALAQCQEGYDDYVRDPPPWGACPEDVVTHVLTEEFGGWRLVHRPIVGDPATVEGLVERDMELLEIFDAECGASAEYVREDGLGWARVLVIGFGSRLHALGFFSGHRGDEPSRVTLTSPAYRNEVGIVHAWSEHFYVRVEVEGLPAEAMPPDQRLAARVEMRLPEVGPRPRILRLMPRGWANPLTVGYGPIEFPGEELPLMALKVHHDLGRSTLTIQTIEMENSDVAALAFEEMLEQALEVGRAWTVHLLGEDAFAAQDGGFNMAMRQDQFLVHIFGDLEREDAETALRLVGTYIRITRPLPEIEEYP